MAHHAGPDNVAYLKYGPGAAADIDPKTGETRYIGWVFFSIKLNAIPDDMSVIRWSNEQHEKYLRDEPEKNVDPGPLAEFGGIVNAVYDLPFVGMRDNRYGLGVYYG